MSWLPNMRSSFCLRTKTYEKARSLKKIDIIYSIQYSVYFRIRFDSKVIIRYSHTPSLKHSQVVSVSGTMPQEKVRQFTDALEVTAFIVSAKEME